MKKKRYYRCNLAGKCPDKDCYQKRPHQHPQAHFNGFKNKWRPCYQGYGFEAHRCVPVGEAKKSCR